MPVDMVNKTTTARKPVAPAPARPGTPAAPATPAAVPAAKPSRRGRWLLLVLLVLAGGGGAAAWMHFDAPEANAAAAPAPAPKKKTVFYAVEPFTVNLTSPTIDRFLQIGFTLEFAGDEAAEELKRQMPVVRSRLLLLLAAKTPEELATTAGKQKLMEEILAEARAPLGGDTPSRGLERVHFSALIIQ